jgi:hypothetical protein
VPPCRGRWAAGLAPILPADTLGNPGFAVPGVSLVRLPTTKRAQRRQHFCACRTKISLNTLSSKVKDKNGNVLAVMANPLLRRKLTLDVMQQHIVHLAVGQIEDPRVEREKLPLFHISVAAYAAATGRSDRSGSVYEQLAKAVRGLQHAEVLIPGGQKIAILAPYAEYIKDESRIEVEFNERLKPYLLGIKEYFSGVPVQEACQLRSGYAISFYLYCVSWNKSNQRGWSMSEQELRDWLSIPPGTLERTCDLKKRVIDQAQRELDSKASLTFRPRALREGRKTAGWFFEIKDNKPRRSSKRQGNQGTAKRPAGQMDEPAVNAVVLEDFDRVLGTSARKPPLSSGVRRVAQSQKRP